MKIEVTGCIDCAFSHMGFSIMTCRHPKHKTGSRSQTGGELPPSWCPLKKESITIELKPNNR